MFRTVQQLRLPPRLGVPSSKAKQVFDTLLVRRIHGVVSVLVVQVCRRENKGLEYGKRVSRLGLGADCDLEMVTTAKMLAKGLCSSSQERTKNCRFSLALCCHSSTRSVGDPVGE